MVEQPLTLQIKKILQIKHMAHEMGITVLGMDGAT